MSKQYRRKKLYNKYVDLIKQDVWTERDIINFRAVLHGYKRTSLTDYDRSMLHEMFWQACNSKNGYNITQEQTDKALKFLLTKKGTVRNTKFIGKLLSDDEIDILQNFKQIRVIKFVGLFDNSNPYSHFKFYLPVYRVISEYGSYFDYYYNHEGMNVIRTEI